MSLQHSYTLLAPLYDTAVAAATRAARRQSLAALAELPPARVLLVGVGTGLDLPDLPAIHQYVGLDLTPAMLRRAEQRARELHLPLQLDTGDAMALPYAAHAFDAVVLHLIVAVVPRPQRALAEAARVTRPGGLLLVFDKFLRPGQRALLRRLVSPLVGRIASRTDVVFEDVLAAVPGLTVIDDRPALANGWFRRIRLRKDDR